MPNYYDTDDDLEDLQRQALDNSPDQSDLPASYPNPNDNEQLKLDNNQISQTQLDDLPPYIPPMVDKTPPVVPGGSETGLTNSRINPGRGVALPTDEGDPTANSTELLDKPLAAIYGKMKELWGHLPDDQLKKGAITVNAAMPGASTPEKVQAVVDEHASQQASNGLVNSNDPYSGLSQEGIARKDLLDRMADRKKDIGDRAKLAQAEIDAGSPGYAALSAFGAGIRGADVGSAFKTAMDASQYKSKNALAQFDKNIEQKQKNRQLDIEDENAQARLRAIEARRSLDQSMKDPSSPTSRNAQDALIELRTKYYGKPTDEQIAKYRMLSANDVRAQIPSVRFDISQDTRKTAAQLAETNRQTDTTAREKYQSGENDKTRAATLDAARITAGQKVLDSLRPSDAIAKTIDDTDGHIRNMDSLLKNFDPSFVGVMKGPAMNTKIGQWLQSPEGAVYRSHIGQEITDYLNEKSGKTVSDAEAARISKNMATADKDPKVFVAMLQDSLQRIKAGRDSFLLNNARKGYNMLPYVTEGDTDTEVAVRDALDKYSKTQQEAASAQTSAASQGHNGTGSNPRNDPDKGKGKSPPKSTSNLKFVNKPPSQLLDGESTKTPDGKHIFTNTNGVITHD